jgi:6-pyruvoyltetrahydropterin/6-carboxytetrahydropterin synthase
MEGTPLFHQGAEMILVTRRAEFSASHVYHNPKLSPEENRRIFGKCNNPHGHGHNYTLEVTVAGSINPATGMVVDLKELKTLLEREVLQVMDHKFLNQEVAAFADRIPTTENIAVEIWNMLAPKLTFGKLHRIRLYETSDLYVDYYGE